jgi:hypothetical protein
MSYSSGITLGRYLTYISWREAISIEKMSLVQAFIGEAVNVL